MVSSWTGGRRLGFMTTAFATLVGGLLFVRPFGASRPLQEETQLVLFAVVGCGISVLAGQLHAERKKAQQQARAATRSHNEISDLIESVQEVLLAFDQFLPLTYMNRAAENMLGRSAGDLLGERSGNYSPGWWRDSKCLNPLDSFSDDPARNHFPHRCCLGSFPSW
jgi:PAS domain-containing protein